MFSEPFFSYEKTETNQQAQRMSMCFCAVLPAAPGSGKGVLEREAAVERGICVGSAVSAEDSRIPCRRS